MKNRLWFNLSAIGAGLLLSGGIVYAASGYPVTALSSTGTVNVNGTVAPISELTYHGVHFYALGSVSSLLRNAHIQVGQNSGYLHISSPYAGSSLSVNIGGNSLGSISQILNSGVPYVNTNTLFSAFGKIGLTSTISSRAANISLPVSLQAFPHAREVSLFSFPHFALGNSNVAGSTSIYGTFQDNLGNTYTLPTMSWNVQVPAGATTPASSSSTSTYQTFYPTAGSNGTFSLIYNLYGKYKAFSATLAPSAYFNNTTINPNTGNFEIVRGNGTTLFTSGNISSGNMKPTPVYVALNGVNQIQVTFTTSGLGLINPILIKR